MPPVLNAARDAQGQVVQGMRGQSLTTTACAIIVSSHLAQELVDRRVRGVIERRIQARSHATVVAKLRKELQLALLLHVVLF